MSHSTSPGTCLSGVSPSLDRGLWVWSQKHREATCPLTPPKGVDLT